MISRFYLTLILVFICCSSYALNNGLGTMTENALEGFTKIKNKTLYFGHQSVGYNIVDGVADILASHSIEGYRIIDISENNDISSGNGFFHSQIGVNGDTESKIAGFKNIIEESKAHIDIAFFKFCYVDIDNSTDVNALFNSYKSTMDYLIETYPSILFLHITAPLRVVQSGPKAWIKNILKKPLGGAADNVKRNQFNQLLKDEYTGSGHVFDLAEIESTLPDGQVNQFDYQGIKYRSLAAEYSNDGKHLNATGRKLIARNLLAFLGQQSL